MLKLKKRKVESPSGRFPFFEKPEFSKKFKELIIPLVSIILMNFGIIVSSFGQRTDINSLTNGQKYELAELIHAWLILNQEIIVHHEAEFRFLHQIENFPIFHRQHVWELDQYIATNSQTGLTSLPKWNPATAVPDYFNGWYPGKTATYFPAVYQNISPNQYITNGRTQEDYSGFLGRSLPASHQLPAQSGGNYLRQNLCGYGNVFDMASALLAWHSDVHQDIGGTFEGPISPSAILFWPWHAFVDEIWQNWDCKCKIITGEKADAYNAYTITENNFVINGSTPGITGNKLIWNTNGNIKKIRGNITIEPGYTLEISNGQIVEFLDSRYACDFSGSSIIVLEGNSTQDGARLIINNGTLRGITTIGYNNDATNPFGVRYESRWGGIAVFGNALYPPASSKHGKVTISNNSIIRDAVVAIESNPGGNANRGGGIIEALQSSFINNRRGILFMNYIYSGDKSNPSFIERCTFNTDMEPLNGFIVDHHFDSNKNPNWYHRGYSIKDYIAMWNVQGIKIMGNTFNTSTERDMIINNYIGDAIQSIDASYTVERDYSSFQSIAGCTNDIPTGNQNQFDNFELGINFTNSIQERKVKILDNYFRNIRSGVTMSGDDNTIIYKNMFIWDNSFNYNQNASEPSAISTSNSKGYSIQENTIDWVSASPPAINTRLFAMNISNSAISTLNAKRPEIKNNVTSNHNGSWNAPFGKVISGNNSNLDITCNIYNNLAGDWKDIGTNLLIIGDQGNPNMDAGNQFSRPNFLYQNIDFPNGTMFNYFYWSLSPPPFPVPNPNNLYPEYSVGVNPVLLNINLGQANSCPPASLCNIYGSYSEPGEPGGDGSHGVTGLNSEQEFDPFELLYNGKYEKAIAASSALQSEDAKTFNLVAPIFANGRNFTSMSKDEVNKLKMEAQNETKTGYYAKTILKVFTNEIVYEKSRVQLSNVNALEEKKKNIESTFSVYPNPATSLVTFTLKAEDISQGAKLQIYDLVGRKVYDKIIPQGQVKTTINLESLPASTYQCIIHWDNGKQQNAKLVLIK